MELLPLAQGFVQADAAGDRDIQAFDPAAHGDAKERVAGFARELAHAVTFCAHHNRGGGFEIGLVQGLRRVVAGAVYPNIALFEVIQGARQIGDHEVGHGFRCAAGDFGHGGVDAHGMVFWGDNGMCARAIGDAQHRAQIVRVGHAV